MLAKKKGLKTAKPETLSLPPGKKNYNNKNLCQYHKNLKSDFFFRFPISKSISRIDFFILGQQWIGDRKASQ